MPDNPKQLIEGEVLTTLDLQKSLDDLQTELMHNEQFRRFLELSKTVPKQIEEAWDRIESAMIENNVKSLKGEWGSITIAERLSFDINMEELPKKFTKVVADSRRIADSFRLEGRPPKGATPKSTKYLTKRIK